MSKKVQKCPPGKILSPKGRCVIDRSVTKKATAIKKKCPPGKILSPKGRCVIDRSVTKKATKIKKKCPPGKILSPKGRCVIDRRATKKSVKKSVKKSTIINGNKKVKKNLLKINEELFNEAPNKFNVLIKKRVLNSSWDGQSLDIYFSIIYLLNKYKNSFSFIEYDPTKNIYYDTFCIMYRNTSNDKYKYKLELPSYMSKKTFLDKINKCNKRFVIIPLNIEWFNNQGSHLNMIIIDNLKKTVERFEPNKRDVERVHGTTIFINFDKQLKKILSNYKYYPPSKFSPFELMFQDIEESNLKEGIKTPRQITDADGYCAAWSLWYADMRLKFPKLDRQQIIEKSMIILLKYKHSLRTFIRSYSFELIKYRQNLLKKKHNNKNCKKMEYTNKIVDMSLKEYKCIREFIVDNYSKK